MSSRNLSNSRRAPKALSAVIALASVSLLAGCGATGNDAPTRTIRQVTDGKDFESGSVKVRNLRIVAGADGKLELVGTFINSASYSDQITGLTINGTSVKLSASPLALPSQKPVIFGGDSANATAEISGLTLVAGTHATVVIAFYASPTATSSVLVTTN